VGRAADGRLEIFVVGEDGHQWHLYQIAPNGDWSGWEDLSLYRPLSGLEEYSKLHRRRIV
jgi:hypothetical protein